MQEEHGDLQSNGQETGKVDIRNTQHKVKKRMEARMVNVYTLANKNQHSDSLARNFASVCQASD